MQFVDFVFSFLPLTVQCQLAREPSTTYNQFMEDLFCFPKTASSEILVFLCFTIHTISYWGIKVHQLNLGIQTRSRPSRCATQIHPTDQVSLEAWKLSRTRGANLLWTPSSAQVIDPTIRVRRGDITGHRKIPYPSRPWSEWCSVCW